MTATTSTLKELIELLHDGEEFYSEAASKVQVPAYSNLFQRLARTKAAIAKDLSVHVTSHGEKVPESGTVFGALRKFYTDIRASIGTDAEGVYVGQLEQTEDRILDAFRKVVTESDNNEVRQIAERYYPEVKRAHDEMRELKHRLAA
ncbi:MAG: PA2169 family four-helix-bundle protein [Tahibacter sp.]